MPAGHFPHVELILQGEVAEDLHLDLVRQLLHLSWRDELTDSVDQVEDTKLGGKGEKVVAIFGVDTKKTEVVSAVDEVEKEAHSSDGGVGKIYCKVLHILRL